MTMADSAGAYNMDYCKSFSNVNLFRYLDETEVKPEHNQFRVTDKKVNFARINGSAQTQTNSWVFPPKAPTPHIYSCSNVELLSTNNNYNGFKGFRKQFSGRFKRLVLKKPEQVTAIPPELKPQLKTIYVY